MLTLQSLAGWEAAVLASIAGARGTLEERYAQIERSGLFAEYPAILAGYRDLLGIAETEPEALKRAVFLVWRSAIAPPVASGIAELPERDVREVLEHLERRARAGALDEEMRAMLAHYGAVSPLPFEHWMAMPHLEQAIRDVAPDAWRDRPVGARTYADRGQLGVYWRALHDEAARG